METTAKLSSGQQTRVNLIHRTAATEAYRVNGISAASTLLGHSNFATTFNHYIDGRAVSDNDCTQLLPTPELPRKPR